MTLTGRLPYRAVLTYERVHDETGREMHKSTGNAIEANEAFEQMGADVMRWQFCAQNPSQNINFGYGPADEVKRRLLTLWNSAGFLVTYANIAGLGAEVGTRALVAARARPLARRPHRAARRRGRGRATSATGRRRVTAAFESFVDDLSNWYIRRSRRAFLGRRARGARDALVVARPGAARGRAGDAVPRRPPLARARARTARTRFTWPAGPRSSAPDEALLEEMAEVRRVVELGRQARAQSGLKLRQPLRRLVVQGAEAAQAQAGEIAEELSVKEVEFGAGRGDRAARQAEPAACSGRSSARSSGRCARSSRPASSRSSTAAACASTATSSRRTRCSSSGAARRAGRSPARTGSPSRSTSRSTRSSSSRAACSSRSTR